MSQLHSCSQCPFLKTYDVTCVIRPTIEDLLLSPLSKFIIFVVNDCRYSGSFTEIFVTVVHPVFLKDQSLKQVTKIVPIGNKSWMDHLQMNIGKELKNSTLEGMVPWMKLSMKMIWILTMECGPS